MIETNIIEDGKGIYVEIDTKIYPESVIDKVLYWFSAEYVISRKRLSSGSVEGISFMRKHVGMNNNWESFISELSDRLIDYKNRFIVHEETKNLRELFFAKAFANSDDFVEFEFKD